MPIEQRSFSRIHHADPPKEPRPNIKPVGHGSRAAPCSALVDRIDDLLREIDSAQVFVAKRDGIGAPIFDNLHRIASDVRLLAQNDQEQQPEPQE